MKTKTEMLAKKLPLSRACRNHYLDSDYTLTVMIPEMIPQTICCKSFSTIEMHQIVFLD